MSGENFAVTDLSAIILTSVLDAVLIPSLQLTKWYSSFGLAVISIPLAPWFTVCGVVPVIEPFASEV